MRSKQQFQLLRNELAEFSDEEVRSTDHERAAEMFNRCRERGVQPTTIDMLICAASARLKAPIFTLDRDFARYARVLGIKLFRVALH